MLPYVVCPSCGLPLGDVYEIYEKKKQERTKDEILKKGIMSTQAAADLTFKVETGDILDSLFIFMDCCRMHISTSMEFHKYY